LTATDFNAVTLAPGAGSIGLRAKVLRKLQQYRDVFALLRRYGSGHVRLLSLYVFLAVFGTLTESFGVFLLVPLLQTMGKTNVFASVPLVGPISKLFE